MRHRKNSETFLLFSIVGAGGTVLHYLVLVFAVELLSVSAPAAAVLGASAGAFLNYILNSRFTFRSRRAHREALPRYLSVALLGALISGAVVLLGTSLGVNYVVSQVAATAIVLIVGYVLNSAWTF